MTCCKCFGPRKVAGSHGSGVLRDQALRVQGAALVSGASLRVQGLRALSSHGVRGRLSLLRLQVSRSRGTRQQLQQMTSNHFAACAAKREVVRSEWLQQLHHITSNQFAPGEPYPATNHFESLRGGPRSDQGGASSQVQGAEGAGLRASIVPTVGPCCRRLRSDSKYFEVIRSLRSN